MWLCLEDGLLRKELNFSDILCWILIQSDWHLHEKIEDTWTPKRHQGSMNTEKRLWDMPSACQGEGRVSEETNPTSTLILDFQPPEL